MMQKLLVFVGLCLVSEIVKVNAIVRGKDAAEGQFPYQVALYNSIGIFECSGALISVDGIQAVLTKVNCLRSHILFAGKFYLDNKTESEQERKAGKVVRHENYSSPDSYNDIGLIFPDKPFELNDKVQPVYLTQLPFEEPRGNITVSGWGRLAHTGSFPEKLRYAEIPTMRWEDCHDDWLASSEHRTRIESQFCSGGYYENPVPCTRDEGAPAINDKGELVGFYIDGYNCGAQPLQPALYTKVSHFLDWITERIADYKKMTV